MTAVDRFGAPVASAVVTELGLNDTLAEIVGGLTFVLVADGVSERLPPLVVAVHESDLPAPDPVTLLLGLAGSDLAAAGVARTVAIVPCSQGYGVEEAGDGLLLCEPCAVGSFSDQTAWEACQQCAEGWTNTEIASTDCDYCAPGYGWGLDDDGDGVADPPESDPPAADGSRCVRCAIGTFSPEATLRLPCSACETGLTTAAAGSSLCGVGAVVGGRADSGIDTIAIVVAAVFVVVGVVALVASCLTNRNARHGAIGTVLLSVRGRWWCGGGSVSGFALVCFFFCVFCFWSALNHSCQHRQCHHGCSCLT